MAGETVITVVGNPRRRPGLRFTPSGAAVANFRIASTPRTFDQRTNEVEGTATRCSPRSGGGPRRTSPSPYGSGVRVIVQRPPQTTLYETHEGEAQS